MEAGTVSLIGATTENPSFSVNPALRSRAILVRLDPLTHESVAAILDGAVRTWDATGATLDVPAAVTRGDRYPFLPVQDHLVAHVKSKTGRSVCSIEIASGLFDNRYYFCDTVQVDYSDGDSDDVYIDDLADFEHVAGSPEPRTLVTIECTSAGITID